MSAIPAVWAQAATRVIWAPSGALVRVRRIGYLVLGLQLAGFMTWSAILYHRFALTWDFSAYHQAWYLIAHGDLNPYNSIENMQFWRNDSEFLLWPLAPFYWIWPHDVVLLWLQDISVVGAEAVAFKWICEIASKYSRERQAVLLACTGLLLLAVNPWIWWSVSFDVHMETFSLPFAVLLARDLARGRRRAWLWVVPIMAAGAPSVTYVLGIGIGGILASRRSRLPGVAMAVLSIGYLLFIVLIHGNMGVSLQEHFEYLATGTNSYGRMHRIPTLPDVILGIVTHPSRVLAAVWQQRTDVVANVAPAGLIGFGSVILLPLIVVVLLTNTLSGGVQFTEPLFQSLPIYVLLPVGTVVTLIWLARRHRNAAIIAAALVIAQALGWAAIWAPRTPRQWLRVSASTAATLADVKAQIPASAEVIASQGVVGPFSGRANVRRLAGHGKIRVSHSGNWFVIAPMAGIEIQTTAAAMVLIGKLAGPLHASLITRANGVWVFRWRPPPGVRSITIPKGSPSLPAWAAPVSPGTVGRPVLTGPIGTWCLASTGGRGYVADQVAWQEPAGHYRALVKLSAAGPVNVEVWDDSGRVLLARKSVPGTTGSESVGLTVDATNRYRAVPYAGWGPFRADFSPPPPGERLEVRVWSPGGHRVRVYGAKLIPVGRATARALSKAGPTQ